MNNRCLVVPGPFLPYNDTITQLTYKHLRLLDMEYDVYSLGGLPQEEDFKQLLSQDPNYQKFHIEELDKYHNILFSIKNINLFKGLHHMKQYVDSCVSKYDGQEYLYTNSFPCYTTRVGVELKKKNPKITWIASFSDPINHSPYKFDTETYKAYSFPEKIAFQLYCKYYVVDKDEANAFEQADILVFICEEQRDFMIQQYLTYFHNIPEETIRQKCVIVPLNYIPEWNTLIPLETVKHNDTFLLSHYGRIYGLRLMDAFLEALALFVKKYPSIPLQIHQFGEFRKSDLKKIQHLGLEHYFVIQEKIPYAKCIEHMKQSDAVLLFDTILPEDTIQPYLPSKVLEYALLQKDCLAITTKTSPTYRIMKQSHAITCAYQKEDILEGLEKLIIQKVPSKIQYSYTNEEAIQQLKKKIEDRK